MRKPVLLIAYAVLAMASACGIYIAIRVASMPVDGPGNYFEPAVQNNAQPSAPGGK